MDEYQAHEPNNGEECHFPGENGDHDSDGPRHRFDVHANGPRPNFRPMMSQ